MINLLSRKKLIGSYQEINKVRNDNNNSLNMSSIDSHKAIEKVRSDNNNISNIK